MGSQRTGVVIGVMSGTSADGIDIAACRFAYENSAYRFELLETAYFDYTPDQKRYLSSLPHLTAAEIYEADVVIGRWFAQRIIEFSELYSIQPELISVHGHTLFHQPQKGFSVQLGCGATIAALTGTKTAVNFRQSDIAHSGQGAPLVPIGDELLFNAYQACLNIGGFANISFNKNNQRIAFDICPANKVLNKLVAKLGLEYDRDGEIGKSGKVLSNLLSKLNDLAYYKKPNPKSLGEEWLNEVFYPCIQTGFDVEDTLCTFYEHISDQISHSINVHQIKTCLATGGGAHNSFLVDLLRKKSNNCEWIVPEKKIIDFKESIIFGFIGWLRLHELYNTLPTATGSSKKVSSGVIWMP